ncbi:cobalamin-5'-phosphate synthase [Rhizobium sp. PP-F2F-G20b]|nr:cobalamin-5'-phosphate synthase [Rhizobium sp. PP-F2F-G20b]
MTNPATTFLTDTMRAVAFLSRLRVPARFFAGDDGRMGRTVRAFPLAGLLITLPASLVFALSLALDADPLLAALLALTVQTLVTGALHEDGLADAADGLGGGRTRGHALEIMKDSRVGAYGVIALVLTLALRAVAIADLADHLSGAGCALALMAIAALSRAGMVWHWSQLPPARDTGVAAGAGQPQPAAVTTALATGVVLSGLLLLVAGVPLVAALIAFAAFAATVPLWTRYVRTMISGHTGDTIGATQQLAETALLVALAIFA